MTEELFLILHKVRGEPAFDIAHKLQIGDEEGWIIPTSGHRAFPYWHHELAIMTWPEIMDDPSLLPPLTPPADWPDHYNLTREPTTASRPLSSLLSLVKKVPKLKIRRV